jgi:hypothetical protein
MAACGGAESKSGSANSGSGEPTVDITGGNGGANSASGNSGTGSNDGPNTRTNVDTPVFVDSTFGQSSISSSEAVEFPAGVGRITRLFISESVDICSDLPVSWDQEPTGDELLLAITLFSGSEDATGTYYFEEFDEEAVTSATRIASGAMSTFTGFGSGEAMEIPSGLVEVTVNDGEVVSGSFELEVDGEFLFGEFRSGQCPGFDLLADC